MKLSDEIIAVIPARGGSKSVPKKNIRLLGDMPLIAYSIETAKKSTHIKRVIVSTDCQEIAKVALAYGAEVPFIRPSKLARDESQDIEYQQHLVEWLLVNEGAAPNLLVILRPTHPLRLTKTVDAAITEFLKVDHADSLRSVRLAEQSPYKMWHITDGHLESIIKDDRLNEPYNMPRQQLPKVYWQDGYVDIVRAQTIVKSQSTTGATIIPYIIYEKTIDVDYEKDFKKLEAMAQQPADIDELTDQEVFPS